MRPWNVREDAATAPDPIAAAEFNFRRLHPIGQWAVLSYSVEEPEQWPEASAVECGPAARVTARSLFGAPVARGLVHCSGKQVLWD